LLLNAAAYTFDWTMEPFAGEALLTVHTGTVPGRERCIFLPWEADAAISVDVDDSVDWFFTATLTGCAVRVYPLLLGGGVRVTHGNGKSAYNSVFTPVSTGVTPTDLQLQNADTQGTTAATGHINGMMGIAMPNEKFVRKGDYVGHVSTVHLNAARQRFRTSWNERVTSFEAAKSSGKPESSCFIWGKRDPIQGWQFWYQSTVQIQGTVKKGLFRTSTRNIYGQSVVLGNPDRFYP